MTADDVFDDRDDFDQFYVEVQKTVAAGGTLDGAEADRLLYNADEFDVDDAYRTVVESYANADKLCGDALMRLWQVGVHCRAEEIDIADELKQVEDRHVDGVGDAVKQFGRGITGMLTYRGWTSPHFDISDYALN